MKHSPTAIGLAVLALVWGACARSEAQLVLQGTRVDFASVERGKDILTRRDDFVQRLSPFDRAARMKTDRAVSEEEYLEFVGQNVIAWSADEKEKIATVMRGLKAELDAWSLPFPENVWFIKTTGTEEGGAPYTRANAVVLPQKHLEAPDERIQKVIAHELWHILSRANPALRDELYAAIGYVKCKAVEFPPELASRKITNPDAPTNEHCIRVKVNGQDAWVMPLLFASAEKYDPQGGGEFFKYLQFQFLVVTRDEPAGRVHAVREGATAKLVGPLQVSGLYEQTGRNSGRIYHPEEVVADNFALLVLRETNLKSPEVVDRMRAVIERQGKAGKRSAAR